VFVATAVWTGTITFGLVSIPVKLFTATTSHNISFNLLHEECKNRINLQNYCPVDERVVERSELVKGYEYEKGKYVIINDEDLEAIKPPSSQVMDIVQFIDMKDLDPIYFEKSYYLGPNKGSEKTFALLTRAMETTNKAAIGKLTMRNHEYLALVRPGMEGLVVQFLLYADEVRENEFKVPEDVELRPKEVQLATQLVENLSEPLKLEKFHDEYVERVEEMIEAKLKGRKLTIVKPKAKPKVADLMEALQKSVQATKKERETKRPAARAVGQTGARLKKAR
jgi:DNA end-binding protein Ku